MSLEQPIEIGKFFKNRNGDPIVVQIKEFEGVIFADARQFYTGADGKSRPTKKGLAITVHRLPELVDLLEKTLVRARELGILREDGT
jgi:Transcriptional Coactivator p15 (PC4)